MQASGLSAEGPVLKDSFEGAMGELVMHGLFVFFSLLIYRANSLGSA